MICKLEGGEAYSKTIRELYKDEYGISIGYGTYGGCFSLSNIPEWDGVSFGNWCSIAQRVTVLRWNHPTTGFTTHPVPYDPQMGFSKKMLLEQIPLYCGHDVWIGHDAIICPQVSNIGNGCIIAAGAVVTKNVEPYTIVAGNPARIIRKRFSDTIIERLEQSEWWNLEFEELTKKMDYFQSLTKE